MPVTTNSQERYDELWKKFEVVKQSVLSQNTSKYAQLMMEIAPAVLLPTPNELDGSESPLDPFCHQLDAQDNSMLEIIDDQLESVQKNLFKEEDEPLSLVINLMGEQPWDELWPKSKSHFYEMDMKELFALAEFYHLVDDETSSEFSKEDFNKLEIIIGLKCFQGPE